MNKCSEYDILSNKIARRKVCFKRFLSSKFARNAKYGSLVAVILTLNNKSVSDFRSIEHCYKKSSTFSHRNACVNVGFVGFVDCCSSTTRRLIVLFSCGDQLTSAVVVEIVSSGFKNYQSHLIDKAKYAFGYGKPKEYNHSLNSQRMNGKQKRSQHVLWAREEKHQ